MIVMALHEWLDEDIKHVRWDEHEDVREIVFKESNEGAILICSEDVIALAKEFNLVVYPKDANL